MLTLLVGGIFVLLLISLLGRINIVREAVGAFVLSAVILWIISNHGGDVHVWAPYVVGFMMACAAVRWCYTLFGRSVT
jgi:hypothetical protein